MFFDKPQAQFFTVDQGQFKIGESQHSNFKGKLETISEKEQTFARSDEPIKQLNFHFVGLDQEQKEKNYILSMTRYTNKTRVFLNCLLNIKDFKQDIELSAYLSPDKKFTRLSVSQNGSKVSWKYDALEQDNQQIDALIEELFTKFNLKTNPELRNQTPEEQAKARVDQLTPYEMIQKQEKLNSNPQAQQYDKQGYVSAQQNQQSQYANQIKDDTIPF